MSKKLILLVAFMSLALLGSSFAAVENIKVSGDIKSGAITRDLSLGSTAGDDGTPEVFTKDQEDFLFSQIRLRFDADLTEGVSTVVQLINERVWDAETNANTDIDLDLGYIQLNEFLYQPLTVKIGRQNLYFGSGLIVGDPDTNRIAGGNTPYEIGDLSLKKSFDALRGTLDYAPYTIDMIYAKVDEGETNVNDDITLSGVNVAYDWASYNGITEGYFFYTQGRLGEQVVENEDKTITLGGRMQYDPNDNWTLGLEGAHQFGDYASSVTDSDTSTRDAWAGIANAEYRFLNDYNAKLGLKYTYLSGDDDSNDSDYEEWDPLFEDQTPGEILNLIPNANVQFITLTGSMMPREDITLGMLYTYARLAEKFSSGNTWPLSASGSPVQNNIYYVDTGEKEIGNEIDAYALYDYTEDVQIKLTGAWFMPGNLFADVNDDMAYSLKAGINVDF